MIKSLAKAGAMATFKFTLLATVSQIICGIFFIVGVGLLLSTEGFSSHGFGGGRAAAHTNGMVAIFLIVLNFFYIDFWPTLLATSTFVTFIPLYLYWARKLSFETALNRIWKYKLQEPITEKITDYIDKSQSIAQADTYLASKKQLIQSIASDDNTPKIQKKIFKYIVKKIDFTSGDPSADELTLKSYLTEKVDEYLSDFAEVNNWPFYALMAAHIVLFCLAIYYNQ